VCSLCRAKRFARVHERVAQLAVFGALSFAFSAASAASGLRHGAVPRTAVKGRSAASGVRPFSGSGGAQAQRVLFLCARWHARTRVELQRCGAVSNSALAVAVGNMQRQMRRAGCVCGVQTKRPHAAV
jgi:hypothetical protein